MEDSDKIIPMRHIPVLTQAEVASIRTPADITRIVQAQPEQEYQIIRGKSVDTRTSATPKVPKGRGSVLARIFCLGGSGYAFGISSASCLLHLTTGSVILVTISSVALVISCGWNLRSS